MDIGGQEYKVCNAMRYYLDTNILAFMLTNRLDELDRNTKTILFDYSNLLYTSSICVGELIHLCQIGKLIMSKEHKSPDPAKILNSLDEVRVSVISVSNKHLQTFSELPLIGDHRDPFDRSIIAQAISDKIPLISSDRKFSLYEQFNLMFLFNRR